MRGASLAVALLKVALPGLLLVALCLSGGCERGLEPQENWSVQGQVRDLSGSPIKDATIWVDVNMPGWDGCPAPHTYIPGFERDFSVRTDASGWYLIRLDAADALTGLWVNIPGYESPANCTLFDRTDASEPGECQDFWFHGGAVHTIDGYIRHSDGSLWTDVGWKLTLSDTLGRWYDAGWAIDGYYCFQVPECGLTFELRGPQQADPQIRIYENVDQDIHDQDFIVNLDY